MQFKLSYRLHFLIGIYIHENKRIANANVSIRYTNRVLPGACQIECVAFVFNNKCDSCPNAHKLTVKSGEVQIIMANVYWKEENDSSVENMVYEEEIHNAEYAKVKNS